MSVQLIGAIGMIGMLALIFLRVPVAICLGVVGFLGYAAIEGWARATTVLGQAPFDIAGAVSLVFLLFLAWQMLRPAYDAWQFGERKQELGLPHWVLWVPMIAGILLSAVALVASRFGRDEPPKEE